MPESTQSKWSMLNDVTSIKKMLIDTDSEHWPTCREYVRYIIQTKFKNLSSESQNDAIQDAMLAVHKNLATFRFDSKLTTWLTTVARSHAIIHLRKQNERYSKETPTENTSEEYEDELEYTLVSMEKTPEQETLIQESLREVFATIEHFLKPKGTSEERRAWAERNREILQMVLIEGESQEETARRLGIPAANVGYIVRTVREYLAQKFERDRRFRRKK